MRLIKADTRKNQSGEKEPTFIVEIDLAELNAFTEWCEARKARKAISTMKEPKEKAR